MATRKYTGEELITCCRDVGMIPDASSTGSQAADLLKKINEAVSLILVPKLLKTREDYFVQRERTTLTSRAAYRIPHRALYSKLKDLWYTSTNGDRYRLNKIPEEERHLYSNAGETAPIGYFLEGEYIVLMPEDATSFSGYLEFVYYSRPGEVVQSTSCGVVASVVGSVITCTADVSALFAAGNKIDVHSAYSGGELKEWGLTVQNVSTTDITVTDTLAGFGRHPIVAGDYVCIAEEAALPALPREWHPLVARAAALYFAESVGDKDGVDIHGSLLSAQLQEAIGAVESRVESKPMRIGRRGIF